MSWGVDDTILLDEEPKGYFGPPREPAGTDPKFIKHVVCEGARFHVLSYSSNGVHCSEAQCIVNKRHV